MLIVEKMAKYVRELSYSDLPPWVVRSAKRLLLDALANMIGGYPSASSQAVVKVIKDLGGTGESTIVGNGLRTSCVHATLTNGVMLRYLDFLDHYMLGGQPIHAAENIPAALAVGERENSTGRDVLTSIVVGYELSNALTDYFSNAPLRDKGWHHSSIGQFVVPLVAGKLLGLNEIQLAHAVAISGCHNFTLNILDAEGEEYDMTKNIAYPFAAQSGVQSALLAKAGFTGPLRIFEGGQGLIQVLKQNPEGPEIKKEAFNIGRTNMKSYAACWFAAASIEAPLELVRKYKLRPEEIDTIKIGTIKLFVDHVADPSKKYPKNKETADHSIHYLVSIGILEGVIGPQQYSSEKMANPKVLDLIGRVTMEVNPEMEEFKSHNPDSLPAIAEVRTKQGDLYTYRVDYPKGHSKNPLSDQEVEAKFRICAAAHMDERQIKKVVQAVNAIDEARDLRTLMKLLTFRSLPKN